MAVTDTTGSLHLASDAGTIFYFGTYHGLVGILFQVPRALVHVPPAKAGHPVCYTADVVDVLVPSEPAINLDPQVIYGVCGTLNITVREIHVYTAHMYIEDMVDMNWNTHFHIQNGVLLCVCNMN